MVYVLPCLSKILIMDCEIYAAPLKGFRWAIVDGETWRNLYAIMPFPLVHLVVAEAH